MARFFWSKDQLKQVKKWALKGAKLCDRLRQVKTWEFGATNGVVSFSFGWFPHVCTWKWEVY